MSTEKKGLQEFPADTPAVLPRMMAKKLAFLQERGCQVLRVVVRVGNDVAVVSAAGKVDWYDENHG